MENKFSRNNFKIEVNGGAFTVADATVSGREILEASHHTPASDFALIIIGDRELRSIGLQEKIDLGDYDTAKFITFEGGEIFQFVVDERGYEWGAETISAADVRRYAAIEDEYELVLDKAHDEPVPDDGVIALRPKGVEHIISRKRPPKTITIIVNTRRKEVEGDQISFEQLIRLAFESLPTGIDPEFTVTYRRGPDNSEGSMITGQTIKIKDRMVFNVSFTDKS